MLCGGGFRDTTRIADGSPEMWHDVLVTNAPAVLREMKAFSRLLSACTRMIGRGDFAGVRRILEAARKQRGLLLPGRVAGVQQ